MNEWELRKAICTMFLNGDLDFPLDANTRLLDDGICDSLGLVQLAAEIERRCPGIRIADQEITRDTFGTIAAIVQFLGQKIRTN